MAKRIIVVGLGQFGGALAVELTRLGHDVLGMDKSEARVNELVDVVTKVIQGDATSPALWRDLPVQDMDMGVIALAEDSSDSAIAAMLLRNAGIKRLIAMSHGDVHSQLLKALGIVRVIEPNREAALRASHVLDAPLRDYMGVVLEYGIARITVNVELSEMTVKQFAQRHKVNILLIARGNKVLVDLGEGEHTKVGDTLVVAGNDEDLRVLPVEGSIAGPATAGR